MPKLGLLSLWFFFPFPWGLRRLVRGGGGAGRGNGWTRVLDVETSHCALAHLSRLDGVFDLGGGKISGGLLRPGTAAARRPCSTA